MKRRLYESTLFVCLLMVCSQRLLAREHEKNVMSLHDCMAYAVSHSTRMRLQEADRSDERWQRRQALMQVFTPVVEAQTYAYNQYGRNLDPETNTYNGVNSFHNGYSVTAGIILFDGFKSVNYMRMASAMVRMGVSKERQVHDEICLATMEAYYNVVYYTKLESVIQEQVSTAMTARDKAVRQEDLGQKGHADVLQMESDVAQKEYMLVNATNKKNDALITLKDVMFWSEDEELQIDHHIQEPVISFASASDLAETAKAVLPSAEIAALGVRQATLGLQMARGAYFPKLSLNGGWSTTYYTYPGKADYKAQSFNGQFRNNAGEFLEVSLYIPIFDQLQRHTSLHLKKNAVIRAKAEYDQTMRDIENEVARAISDRDGALAAFRQAEKLSAYQQEVYLMSIRQFENGLISAIEYQTASQNYLNAMAERVNALLTLRLKDSIVRYYQGEPYL